MQILGLAPFDARTANAAAGLRPSNPSRTAPSRPARRIVYAWRMVLSLIARTRSGSVSSSIRLPGLVLLRIARTRPSMCEGRSRSSRVAPNGSGSRRLRLRLAYSSLVDGLRSEAARVVARQCASQAPTVVDESFGGWPSSIRSRTLASSAIAALRLGP